MNKLKMHSLNKVEENIEKIGRLFPNCLTERKGKDGQVEYAIDFDVLRQELSDVLIEGIEERYQFTWPDKRKSMLLANTPIAKTLRPCREESVDFDNTQNLYIEGDNLDVLKLLQETYLGKVKMIYIDPPYNTGNDFVYEDDFAMAGNEFMDRSGMYDEEGNQLFDMKTNNESNGRFHTDWLNMIYPRLKVAKDLLSDDGVIFISIDDNESANLTKICDEVFGLRNRIALICHKSRASISNDKIISPNHNSVLFYCKNIDLIHVNRKKIGLDPDLDGFNLDDKDGKGAYRLVPVDGPGGAKKGNPYYEFLGVEQYFRFSKETMIEKYNNGLVVKKGSSLYQKYYKSAAECTRKTDTTWWDDGGLTSSATSKLRDLIGGAYFDNPKPCELITRMLKLVTFEEKEAIILDFFSGSATTAHAVMQLNAEDGGNRKFICVQLPEATDEKSEAHKAGYNNICEIGKERIRRAGKKIKEDNKDKENIEKLDVGFRVLKLDSTNMKDVYYRPEEYTPALFSSLTDNIKADRTPEDLLFQVMLELGVLPSSKIEEQEIDGKRVFNVADGYLITCFDEQVTESTVTAIAKQKPYYFVMRDSSMASDSVATNFEQLFETYSKETIRRVL